MNTVKLLLCSIPSTGLFGNTDNQGISGHPWLGLQWLCAVWLYLLECLKSGIKFQCVNVQITSELALKH